MRRVFRIVTFLSVNIVPTVFIGKDTFSPCMDYISSKEIQDFFSNIIPPNQEASEPKTGGFPLSIVDLADKSGFFDGYLSK